MKKFQVLIVDDEKPARETLSYLIGCQDAAFEVAGTAKNGRDALDQYLRFQPELIITDIQMPVMDGLALIKAVRQENRRQKFIILSCHEKFSYAKEALQMGVTDYLIKDLITPQDLSIVLSKVQRELEEDIIWKRIELIKKAVENNDEEQLSQGIRLLYRHDMRCLMQSNYLKEVNAQMYGLIMGECTAFNIRYEDVFGCNYLPIERVEDLGTAFEIGEWFQKVFVRVINLKAKLKKKRYGRHIKDAIDFIESNYRRNIGLSEIAEALNLHKVYLCRLFKQEIGENLVNYILKLRIEEAKRMMLSTNNKLYEIAEYVGYQNIQQFSVAFKKYTGLTPREFRDSQTSS